MRYHFFPLGLVLVLAACGQDPTGPTSSQQPQVDAGRGLPNVIPIEGPTLCQKRLGSRVDQGGFEALPHPICRKVQ